ncbi:MAG: hypothetical protein AAF908_00410 [Pseudomonadota bacterium]
MPNFDGGHYFLTVLTPVRVDRPPEGKTSYIQRLREALAAIPTAQQSPATVATAKRIKEETGLEVLSPFAKTPRTHLCRYVIIEDTIYNGRIGVDAILASVGLKPQPTEPQHIDTLPSPYLLWSTNFDAIAAPGETLPSEMTPSQQSKVRDAYLRDLWSHSSAELKTIYENCQGFESVESADDFVGYIKRCQIETWMPFNDYYVNGETGKLPSLNFRTFGIIIGVPLLIFALSGLAWLTGMGTWLGMPAGVTALLAAVLTGGALYGVVQYIQKQGQKAWPAARYGDLPSVLKGLYIQQKFADFVVENQGAGAEDLHRAFGAFLAEHEPGNLLDKTQAPGVIRS